MQTRAIVALLGIGQARSEDKSLSVASYVEKGVPAPDRDWSAGDYKTALEALTNR